MKWVSDATTSEIKKRKKKMWKGDEGTRSVAKLVSGIVESTAGGLRCDPVKVVVNPGRGGKAYAGAGEKTKINDRPGIPGNSRSFSPPDTAVLV